MPQLEVRTVSANSVWKSPDGQRQIWDLQMDYKGQPVQGKTYSEVIATPGWSGTVETYEKEGKPGMPSQTFVKQPPKEGGYQSGSSTFGGGGNTRSSGNYQPRDDSHIKAQWAIGQAVTLVGQGQATFSDIEAVATDLFAMVDRVKVGEPATKTIADTTTAEVQSLFAQPPAAVNEEEKPWPGL